MSIHFSFVFCHKWHDTPAHTFKLYYTGRKIKWYILMGNKNSLIHNIVNFKNDDTCYSGFDGEGIFLAFEIKFEIAF